MALGVELGGGRTIRWQVLEGPFVSVGMRDPASVVVEVLLELANAEVRHHELVHGILQEGVQSPFTI